MSNFPKQNYDVDFSSCAEISNFLKQDFFVNIPEIICKNKAIPLTVGKGLIFNSPDMAVEKFLQNYYEKNNIQEALYTIEQYCSMFGKAIVYLAPSQVDGEWNFRVANWTFINRVGRIDRQGQVAEIYDSPAQADNVYFRKLIFTPNKVTEEHYQTEEIRVGEANAPITKKLRTKSATYTTGFNFMPFVEIPNLPYSEPWFITSTWARFQPDWKPIYKLIVDVQQAIKIKRTERINNKTRINMPISASKISEMSQLGINGGYQELVEANGVLSVMSNSLSSGTAGIGVEMLQGDPKLDVYNNDINNSFENIFNLIGYDWSSRNQGVYTNETQTQLQGDRDKKTTIIKRQVRMEALYTIFNMLLFEAGLWDGESPRNYTISFLDASTQDLIVQMDDIEKRLDLGLMTRAKAISERENISLSQAKKELEEIEKENEQFGIVGMDEEQQENMTQLDKQTRIARDKGQPKGD